jgi:hypothetical protein
MAVRCGVTMVTSKLGNYVITMLASERKVRTKERHFFGKVTVLQSLV